MGQHASTPSAGAAVAEFQFKSPLNTDWSPEPVRLWLAGVAPGEPLSLAIDGQAAPFQYTGQRCDRRGAEVFVVLGFEKGQARRLAWRRAASSDTDLSRAEVDLSSGASIGVAGAKLALAAPRASEGGKRVEGPLAGVDSCPMASSFFCDQPLESAALARIGTGPLFEEYELAYRFAQNRRYTLLFRCWRHEPIIEVSERFSLGMGACQAWALNPSGRFDAIVSRDSFEGESQPTVEPLSMERVRDVLCRLQMPVLTEYFIPNNRGWFGLIREADPSAGMVGVLGLYGARWSEPVANMPEVFARGGRVEWNASLCSGSRHWLLYRGPAETSYTRERRFVFHRLHAQFNACRLDEHLDLSGDAVFDAQSWQRPGLFGAGDIHAAAADRVRALPPLQRVVDSFDEWSQTHGGSHAATFRALIDPTPANRGDLHDRLIQRFEKWVRQFQGWRTGENDYQKNVIGFSRWLRGMMIAYELMRGRGWLSEQQTRTLGPYFVFAARRITDQGRWPHERTTLHPDHPQSVRDFYAYGGEHKPDRLYWTNSLPNFQSDPLCALAHLSALFPEHPDADAWRRLALDDLDAQLDAYCGKSGAWEESINYALYTLTYFVITFRVLKQKLGIDYFQDPRARAMVEWLVEFFGPRDRRFDAWTWPAVGNAVLPQNQAESLLAFASELDESDPLARQCVAVYQRCEERIQLGEHYATVLAAFSRAPRERVELPPARSRVMDDVGVSLRHDARGGRESYFFQKIGFAKDHYEADESAFNWYAKGTPLCMDYGTYTGDAATAGAHNLVEIPDADPLRRGYLRAHHFTPLVDFTRCEAPVTLKLLWGRVRSFDEVDGKDGVVAREKTPYFYIGDRNPVGPKVWKVRLTLFVKPDYVALFDRVYGDVPHRFNLHVAGRDLRVEQGLLHARGDFDLDLLGLVQHPRAESMTHEVGRLVPQSHRGAADRERHAQGYWRLYNREDGVYRTLLFARERDRAVKLSSIGRHGMRVETAEYTDHVFLHDDVIDERGEGFAFVGRSGWIRRWADGRVAAMMIDGDVIESFGVRLSGRGPWEHGIGEPGKQALLGGAPRAVRVERVGQGASGDR